MGENTEQTKKRKKSGIIFYSILALIFILVLSLTLVFRKNYFIVQVGGPSMNPTLYGGERVSGNKYINGDYLFVNSKKEPEQFSIVIIEGLEGKNYGIIKRIIGMPNDTVEIKDGNVYVNGILLVEKYLDSGIKSGEDGKWILGEDEYFYMGDNRAVSLDARINGPCKRENITGVVSEWSVKHKSFITKFIRIFRKNIDGVSND